MCGVKTGVRTDNLQVEVPDYWLDFNPWEFPRHDIVVDIQFYGHVNKSQDESGKTKATWEGGEIVKAVVCGTFQYERWEELT